MSNSTGVVEMVEDIIDNHEDGIIVEEEREQEVIELAQIIEQERSQGRIESDQLNKAKDDLFEMLCLKDYLDQCEPVTCVHRITGNCEYIELIGKLNQDQKRRITP